MKFKDPLASLKYLGGPVPNHIGLACFAGWVYFYHRNQIDCKNEVPPELIEKNFKNVLLLFCAHVIYVLCHIWQKTLSNQNDAHSFSKTILVFISTAIYFAMYMFNQY